MTFNKEKFMGFVEELPRISLFNPIKLEYSRDVWLIHYYLTALRKLI